MRLKLSPRAAGRQGKERDSMLTSGDKLLVLRELISCAVAIACTEYDARTFQPLSGDAEADELRYFFFSMDDERERFWTPDGPKLDSLRTENGYRPIVCTNSLGMVWIAEIEELDGKPWRIHVLGPVFVSDYSVQSIEERLAKHTLSDEVRRKTTEFLHSIPVVSTTRFYEYGLMLHWCLTGERISISELIYLDSPGASASGRQRSVPNPHGTYLAEQRMLQSVREGNLQYRKELDHLASSGYTASFISRNDLRYMKNYVIIYTALCCRAAVQGGLDAETAYTLSDQYLESIEQADRLSSLHELSNAMVKDYIERVHRAKTASDRLSPQIRIACEWIALEPEGCSIHSLAEKLGYTDYYFSKRFKRETGVSVREYILTRKLEEARRLLGSTGISVAELCDRLGIESQSYFSTCFRKAFGVTPKEYRKTREEKT